MQNKAVPVSLAFGWCCWINAYQRSNDSLRNIVPYVAEGSAMVV